MAHDKGFATTETLAIIALIVLICGVAFALSVMPHERPDTTNPQETSSGFDEKVQDLQNTKKTVVSSRDIFSESLKDMPFNERLFNDIKKQLDPKSDVLIQSGRMQGEVTAVDTQDGLRLSITGLLPTVKGRQMNYFYTADNLSNISVTYGTISDIAVGDKINIDETNDFSQPYSKSIKSVVISKVAN